MSIDRDDRLDSFCVTASTTYRDFLALTEGAEENLKIQRTIIRGSKAYATLRSDLKRGCVLPPIVLAVNVQLSRAADVVFQDQQLNSLTTDFATINSGSVYVIDGLQRTNALRQAAEEIEPAQLDQFLDRSLRLEMWLNIPFGAIAYRMLLLNAGQRPMSVKHQVEILSSKLTDDLSGVQGLDIFRISDSRRRTQPGQFALAKLAQAFQAWLQGQPNLDLRNTVMEELLAESAIEVLGNAVPENVAAGGGGDGFRQFVNWLVQLDFALGPERIGFLGAETTLWGLAAAVGWLERSEALKPRLWQSLNTLLAAAKANPSALALEDYDLLRLGSDPNAVNVGSATREMVFNAFKEYVRGGGDTPMTECWRFAAAR
ncbi:MAG: hypothetical protein KBC94_02505 [Pseudacidovorax sp.]|nr:hypothetical protein [Pseudacidovorax sp.]